MPNSQPTQLLAKPVTSWLNSEGDKGRYQKGKKKKEKKTYT